MGKGVCGHGLYGATFTLQMDSTAPHYLAMCYPYTYTELQVNHMHPCIQKFEQEAERPRRYEPTFPLCWGL